MTEQQQIFLCQFQTFNLLFKKCLILVATKANDIQIFIKIDGLQGALWGSQFNYTSTYSTSIATLGPDFILSIKGNETQPAIWIATSIFSAVEDPTASHTKVQELFPAPK